MSERHRTPSPKYGYRPCGECGKPVPLRIQRDKERKQFCSEPCRSKTQARRNLERGSWPPVLNEEATARRIATLQATWERDGNPRKGKKQTAESKRKNSEAKKRFFAKNPDRVLRGEKHPNWKGGKTRNGPGYVMVKVFGWYRPGKWDYAAEHRVVASEMLGRKLKRWEVVHHRNGDKTDNRPENLEVLTSAEHARLHGRERKGLNASKFPR